MTTTVGIDFSSAVVKNMTLRRQQGSTGLHYSRMDARKLSFSDESFDAVVGGSIIVRETLSHTHMRNRQSLGTPTLQLNLKP